MPLVCINGAQVFFLKKEKRKEEQEKEGHSH
jgi:hypothetical protein